MDITLEQVERLREKADVSYAQAKEALEYSGGNLLDALIYLEGNDPTARGGLLLHQGGNFPPARLRRGQRLSGWGAEGKESEKEKGRQYGSRRGKARERGSQGPAPHLAPLADRK